MPSVVLVTERFVGLAKAVTVGEGLPGQPSLEIAGNPEFSDDSQLAGTIEELAGRLVDMVAPNVHRRAVTSGAR